MTKYYKYVALFVSMAVLQLKTSKDTTAQGVAKIRHCESLLDREKLYEDPYAHQMYFGSTVQTWMGGSWTRRLFDGLMTGMFDALTLRTKFLDDAIVDRAKLGTVQQLVILGAGYDTRGFRLDLPDGFKVVEVDQPGVQSRKRQILERIARTDERVSARLGGTSATTSQDENETESSAPPPLQPPQVEFLEIDFNQEFSWDTLLSSTSLDGSKKTIVTLEGVSQYIPAEDTAKTLKEIIALFPDVLLLISYVPEDMYANLSKRMEWMLKAVDWIGEPWITSWSPESFKEFLKDCGYGVVSDVSVEELNDLYLVPKNRGRPRDELASIERYVVASVYKEPVVKKPKAPVEPPKKKKPKTIEYVIPCMG